MSFTAQFHGGCGFCDEDMKDTEVNYAPDGVLVHEGCLVPYSTGVDPEAMPGRNEKMCESCFSIHAGECV